MAGLHIIVMGVAGSGKSSVASALGEALGLDVIEGDYHHPPTNVAKMAAGVPLTDEDRRPWLQALADLVGARHADGVGTVLACSALRRAYRDLLRSTVPAEETFVIELDADVDTLRARMRARAGHYMPTSLLGSQLATLEHLSDDGELGVIIGAGRSIEAVTDDAIAAVRAFRVSIEGSR